MPKIFYRQSVCLLTDGRTTIADVRTAVEAAGHVVIRDLHAGAHWEFGGLSVVIAYRPEMNGTVVIDVIDHPWPDSMGDPKSDPTLFGAWSLGQFGPFVFPGGLQRASDHAWSWPQGREAVGGHRGVIRLRMTYAGGLPDDAPIAPTGCESLAEMEFMTRLVIAIGVVPGAICYFNPNGEVLRDLPGLISDNQACTHQQKLPLHLWSNARLFRLSPELGFMDTVGNEQLDIADVEAVYPTESYEPGDVDYYMRNVTYYLLQAGRELKRGEAIDGPGEDGLSWVIDVPDGPLVSPPRRVVRLFPKANAKAIREALGQIS